jgi:putative NIF3 family GTP cyclohydrolase 1 type 2
VGLPVVGASIGQGAYLGSDCNTILALAIGQAGMYVICGGHYETETVGAKALGRVLEKKFPVKTLFLDVPALV